jgi:acylphosphatase
MSKKRLHLLLTGRVQGVNFRNFVAAAANQIQVTGWVRNLNDGRVEVLAEGEEEILDKLRDACREGPAFGRVDALSAYWEESSEEFDSFVVARSAQQPLREHD